MPRIDTAFKRHLALMDGIDTRRPRSPDGPRHAGTAAAGWLDCRAGRPVGGHMGFPAFNEVFRLSAAAADDLAEHAGIALF